MIRRRWPALGVVLLLSAVCFALCILLSVALRRHDTDDVNIPAGTKVPQAIIMAGAASSLLFTGSAIHRTLKRAIVGKMTAAEAACAIAAQAGGGTRVAIINDFPDTVTLMDDALTVPGRVLCGPYEDPR